MSDLEHVAIERLRAASEMSLSAYGEPLIVTTSGGKDPSVCVELAQRAGIPFEVMHNHTTADAVEAVRCKDCRFGKPYKRTDGNTGYYCGFCGHSFRYGMNWERAFNPIKEAGDFCSYGERRTDNG